MAGGAGATATAHGNDPFNAGLLEYLHQRYSIGSLNEMIGAIPIRHNYLRHGLLPSRCRQNR
jgi:hypothetical protein